MHLTTPPPPLDAYVPNRWSPYTYKAGKYLLKISKNNSRTNILPTGRSPLNKLYIYGKP